MCKKVKDQKYKNEHIPGSNVQEDIDRFIIKKIIEVREKLLCLKEQEIADNKFLKASDEERKLTREKFKAYYKEYDDITKTEDEEATAGLKTVQCMYECIQTQALISRITNKIQREEATLIKNKSEEIKRESEEIKRESEEIRKDSEKIKKGSEEIKRESEEIRKNLEKIENENTKLKDSIITVSSLVFMSFTFIQLNFVAFQRSSDYGVLDRIILFSGINTFVIVGIYSIILMINILLSGNIEDIKEKHKYIQKRLLVVLSFFVVVYASSLFTKSIKDENPEIKTLRLSLIEKKEEIKKINELISVLNIESQDINELKSKYEKQVEDLKKQLSNSEKTLEKLNKYASEEYMVEYSKNIEEKVLTSIKKKHLETEKKIKLVKKEEDSKEKIENRNEKSS